MNHKALTDEEFFRKLAHLAVIRQREQFDHIAPMFTGKLNRPGL